MVLTHKRQKSYLSSFAEGLQDQLNQLMRIIEITRRSSTENSLDNPLSHLLMRGLKGCTIGKPKSECVKSKRESHPELFPENRIYDAISPYDLKLTSISCYLDNWKMLSSAEKSLVRSILESDLSSNCYQYGMKRQTQFSRNLLFMGGTVPSGLLDVHPGLPAQSLLKSSDGLYSGLWVKHPFLDPKTCRTRANKFLREFDPSSLLSTHRAFSVVVQTKENQPIELTEMTHEARSSIHYWFSMNTKLFSKWQRSGLIGPYVYSHEFSSDSILKNTFRPHSHLLMFLPSAEVPPDLNQHLGKFESSRHIEMRMEPLRQAEDVEKFISYITGAYSLVDLYDREWGIESPKIFNQRAMRALGIIVDLYRPLPGSPKSKRSKSSRIPKRRDERGRHNQNGHRGSLATRAARHQGRAELARNR